MKLLFFACADTAIVDARNNRASLVNLVEELNAPIFPAVQPVVNIFALLEREPNEKTKAIGKLKLSFGDQILISTNIDIDFQGQSGTRTIATIQGIVFEKPGRLLIELRVGNRVGRWVVPVNAASPPQIAAPMMGTIQSSEKTIGAKKPRKNIKKRAAKKKK